MNKLNEERINASNGQDNDASDISILGNDKVIFPQTNEANVSKLAATSQFMSNYEVSLGNNINQNLNTNNISVEEAYKILNLDPKKKYTKDEILNSYKKIMKKIHPDVSPEHARLASIVNESKDVILKNLN